MHLIVMHSAANLDSKKIPRLLELANSDKIVSEIAFGSLASCGKIENNDHPLITIPEKWRVKYEPVNTRISYYNGRLPLEVTIRKKQWSVFSNGRFVSKWPKDCFREVLSLCQADIVTLTMEPELSSYRENVLFTSSGNIAGFRRIDSDLIGPGILSAEWPHHIFIRSNIAEDVLKECLFPIKFSTFLDQCKNKSLKLRALRVGGHFLDLETHQGLLAFLTAGVDSQQCHFSLADSDVHPDENSNRISQQAKIVGNVVLGRNVRVDKGAVIIGPAIIGSGAAIAPDVLIRASVVGPGVEIPKGAVVQDRIILEKNTMVFSDSASLLSISAKIAKAKLPQNNFRTWRWFSYPRLLKRVVDIFISLGVLTLFAPIFPVVALAIKLTSSGPVFFAHNRQGLHGREFKCLKFRTMITGADEIQDKLRFKNEVDGPQFKVENDPRVTAVGKFLRDTYIDEIPQFINILLGQMSVVGPRPSPESENSQCPFWRDARLSVRPGVTGMWQIYRTRKPYRDFQEWIYFDIQYTRNLSFSLDLLICWRTARKLIINFIDRF